MSIKMCKKQLSKNLYLFSLYDTSFSFIYILKLAPLLEQKINFKYTKLKVIFSYNYLIKK